MSNEHPLFTIHSPTKITLSREACELARMNSMTHTDMARHLLQQHALREAGAIQRERET
jgi:hypothetical protein